MMHILESVELDHETLKFIYTTDLIKLTNLL